MWAARRLGWIPDAVDKRDTRFEMLGVERSPPDTYTLLHLTAPIPDQLNTNSCIGQAVRQAFYIEEKRLHGQADATSALGHYYNARARDGVEHLDVGARIRSALKALKYHGALRESEWPFQPFRVNQRPTPLAYRSGLPTRGPHHYYSIQSSGEERLDDIRRAIAAGHGPIFGTPVTAAITDEPGEVVVDKPRAGDHIKGGHAMCLVGYAPGRFLAANSYGSSYRQQGYVWLTDNYMAWERTHSIWVLAL